MIDPVAPLLSIIVPAVKAMNWFSDLNKKTKGDVRALLEELKENSRLCFRVVEDNVAIEDVISRFSTVVFDRLNESGFDFNAIKRNIIPKYVEIESTNLSAWPGKHTSELIQSIYDKIKNLRSIQLLVPTDLYRRRRVINIHKRILLLLKHAKS